MPSTDPNKYVPTTWGQTATEELTVPSGQQCLVRKMGPTALMQSGLLDAADLLSEIAGKHIDRVKRGVQDEDIREVLKDPQKVTKALEMIDKMVCVVVVEPKVMMAPKVNENRVPGGVYTDMIDEPDKIFIVQWVMEGQKAVAPFREGHGPAAGAVGNVKAVPAKPRKTARSRAR